MQWLGLRYHGDVSCECSHCVSKLESVAAECIIHMLLGVVPVHILYRFMSFLFSFAFLTEIRVVVFKIVVETHFLSF